MKKPKGNWVLFPIRGLVIENAKFGLNHPIFPDVTLLSNSDVKKALKLLRMPIRNLDDFSSIIAVRQRREIQNTNATYKKSRNRANLFASTLSLVVFSNYCGYACNFASQQLAHKENLIMMDFDTSTLVRGPHIKYRVFHISLDGIRWKYSEVKKRILDPKLSFGKILYDKNTHVHASFYDSIKAATILLFNAISTNDLSSQLLSTISAIEILLTIDRVKFEVMKQRLISLIASVDSARHEDWVHEGVTKMFALRHDFVHKGRQVEDQGIVYQAVLFALSALILFSYMSRKLNRKQNLIDYLDKITLINGGQSHKKEEKQIQKLLVKAQKNLKEIDCTKIFF